MDFDQILKKLHSMENPEAVKGMSRYGINPVNNLGISVYILRKVGKQIGVIHELALRLWDSGIHDARLLACFIDDPSQLSGKQMDIPVAVVTDLDIKPDEYATVDETATTEKDFNLTEQVEKKCGKYNNQKVKTFVSPHWTMEYCLARSKVLAPLLYDAVKANMKARRKASETYDEFSQGKSQERIAFDLYWGMILGKGKKPISKPIVAQQFAAALEKAGIAKTSFADEHSTGYLIDAIRYVTSGNNNQ